MKHFLCTVSGCINEGKYCRLHMGGSIKEKPEIKPRSKKLETTMRKQYRPLVGEVLKEHPFCRVNSPVCTKQAEGLHHMKGREGELLTDPRFVIPCCNKCNQFLEQNDSWSRQNGFKLSKHSNYKRVKI